MIPPNFGVFSHVGRAYPLAYPPITASPSLREISQSITVWKVSDPQLPFSSDPRRHPSATPPHLRSEDEGRRGGMMGWSRDAGEGRRAGPRPRGRLSGVQHAGAGADGRVVAGSRAPTEGRRARRRRDSLRGTSGRDIPHLHLPNRAARTRRGEEGWDDGAEQGRLRRAEGGAAPAPPAIESPPRETRRTVLDLRRVTPGRRQRRPRTAPASLAHGSDRPSRWPGWTMLDPAAGAFSSIYTALDPEGAGSSVPGEAAARVQLSINL
ncbi:hypothetical protein PVAP13_3NG325323 [Panicum virgatum]|uniref:Uncharacterized protein n=1 Tax=Panicum virgatum TaxID=38727 RepID=A0A8T0UHQ3_PANVG|nr:hypothetical protein PVAP13_3NG325323 [Panicum virgatum]